MHTRTVKKLALLIIMIMLAITAIPEKAEADAVTDKISVAIGYTGMELKEYVTVGDYHWVDLMHDLPVYEQAYSYYQNGRAPKFTEIVDAARGFYLLDFLEYAHVNYDDILNLKFYVVDHNDIQAAFDRDVLFRSRYYFEDYNGHLFREYDDDFELKSVDSSDCWNYTEEVSPMLALEDNWLSYTEEFEHSLPDFDHANPSTRFRLLFGQTFPEETLTSSSAKYVRTVYVTLTGKPEFDDDFAEKEIDGSYGSHEIDTTVSVKSDMRGALQDLIKFNSTNDKVLVIKGITMEQDDFYTDLVHIKINYDIIGEGVASISARFGNTGEEISATAVVTGEPDSSSEGGGLDPSDKTDPSDPDDEKSDGSEQKKGGQPEENSSSRNKSNGGGSGSGGNRRKQMGTNSEKQTARNTTSGHLKTQKKQTAKAQASATVAKAGSVFALSKDIQKKLNQNKDYVGAASSSASSAASEKVTQMKMKDNKKEKEEQRRMILLLTCLGSIAVVSLGSASEAVSFSVRLKKGM